MYWRGRHWLFFTLHNLNQKYNMFLCEYLRVIQIYISKLWVKLNTKTIFDLILLFYVSEIFMLVTWVCKTFSVERGQLARGPTCWFLWLAFLLSRRPSVCTEVVEKFPHRIPAVDHACNLVVCLVNDFNVTKMMFITGKLINISKKTEKKLNVYKLAEYSKSLIWRKSSSARNVVVVDNAAHADGYQI